MGDNLALESEHMAGIMLPWGGHLAYLPLRVVCET